MIERILSPELVEALGWTLLHTLWQGGLFALLLGLVLIALRTYSAQARYLVAVGFMGAFFLTVGLTFASQYQSQSSTDLRPERQRPSAPASTDLRLERQQPSASIWRASASSYFDHHLPLIVTLWLMGVLFLQLRFLGQLVYIQRLKSYATERLPPRWAETLQQLETTLDIRRPVRYLTSRRVDGPFTTGWLRPVVMLPQELLKRLSDHQLTAIMAHELAHIKRHDFAVNLLQTVLSTFFFYHPGVWWMSARIHDEREHCCDDLAVRATGAHIDYARTLIELQESSLATPRLAMAYGGGGFGHRIRRLLGGYLGTATFGEGVMTTLIFVAIGSLAIATTGNANNDPNTTVAAIDSAPATPPDQIEEAIEASIPRDEIREAVQRNLRSEARRRIEDRAEGRFDFHMDMDVHEDGPTDSLSPDREFQLLMRNIYEGEVEMVRYLLERVNDLSRQDEHDFTPLMAAARENEAEITRMLLDRGAEVNQLNRHGWTALTEAADEGSTQVARLLIQAGADVNLTGSNAMRTPLTMAASEGHPEIVRLLLANGADINAGQLPPLHSAANEGQDNVVRQLLKAGADVNRRDHQGRTPLQHAAMEDKPRIVSMLLEMGADPDIEDDDGNTAAIYAAREDSEESLAAMGREMGDAAVDRLIHTPELLVGPAGEGNLFVVKAMLEMGIDVNIVDEHGHTALSRAANEGKLEVAEYLLERGAQVQGASGPRCSPVIQAANEGHSDMIELLVNNGAELENGCNFRNMILDNSRATIASYDGATALISAIEEHHLGVVKTLLDLGADPNATLAKSSYRAPRGMNWRTTHELTEEEILELAEVQYDTNAWTPLLEAVEADEPEMVRLLLKAGADVDHATPEGMTALGLAQQHGYTAIIELLR